MNHEPFDSELPFTKPKNLAISKKIVQELKKYTVHELQTKKKISEKIAIETHHLFARWKESKTGSSGIPSIFAYTGDVYNGLDAMTLDLQDLLFANKHLRILSGLYGCLNPSDHIMPYRLEIGYNHVIGSEGKLYQIWKPIITQNIMKDLKTLDTSIIYNLASKEYSTAINQTALKNIQWIDFDFFEEKDGQLKFASYNAKRARGLMARYIIKNRIVSIEDLIHFDYENYKFCKNKSTENNLVFVR